jgi:hypothetical protein
MKIYFAGSITGGRNDQAIYATIIAELGKYGTVLTVHVGDKNLTDQGETSLAPSQIYSRDMAWIGECDLLVAEVTTPGHGVGYEICRAESLHKPVLCIYRQIQEKRISSIIYGNPYIQLHKYENLEDLSIFLKRWIFRAAI